MTYREVLSRAIRGGKVQCLKRNFFGFVQDAMLADGSSGIAVVENCWKGHVLWTDYLFIVRDKIAFRKSVMVTEVDQQCEWRERQLRWLAMKLEKGLENA